jgi:hypothetical protein
VAFGTSLSGDLAQRVATLDATILSHEEAIELIGKGGFK